MFQVVEKIVVNLIGNMASPQEQPNENAYAAERARRGVQVQEEDEDARPLELYNEDSFKKYVAEKYEAKDKNLFENPVILQMIYALEWYDIPRSAKPDLIEFHPYLTDEDYEKVYYIKS